MLSCLALSYLALGCGGLCFLILCLLCLRVGLVWSSNLVLSCLIFYFLVFCVLYCLIFRVLPLAVLCFLIESWVVLCRASASRSKLAESHRTELWVAMVVWSQQTENLFDVRQLTNSQDACMRGKWYYFSLVLSVSLYSVLCIAWWPSLVIFSRLLLFLQSLSLVLSCLVGGISCEFLVWMSACRSCLVFVWFWFWISLVLVFSSLFIYSPPPPSLNPRKSFAMRQMLVPLSWTSAPWVAKT